MTVLMRMMRSVGEMRSEIDELVDLRTNTVDGMPTYDARPGVEDIGVGINRYESERAADGWVVKIQMTSVDLVKLQGMHDFDDVFALYLIAQIQHSDVGDREFNSTLKCVVFTGVKVRSLRQDAIQRFQSHGECSSLPVEFVVQERVEFMDRDLRYVATV